jgi:hypothetical protein
MQDTAELKLEMFMDDDMAEVVFHGRAPWLKDVYPDRQCPGLEPTLFKDGVVPMKQWSPDHRVASNFFALANRAGNAKQPTYLLSGSLPAGIALQHFIEGTIVSSADQATIGFTRLVTPENYLHLKWEHLVSFSAGEAESILNAACALLDSA